MVSRVLWIGALCIRPPHSLGWAPVVGVETHWGDQFRKPHMKNVTAECDGSVCDERCRRFEAELGYEVGRKISKLHDRKGILFINWAERPTAQDIAIVTDAWGRHGSDPITYHYEEGVELVGCAPRYNPFDASDHPHLAAIEHLRTARDLLKKTTKRMKQIGTGPGPGKRLFQALKLTESALRHARRSHVTEKNENIERSA
jgi:hypothetical protein